MQRKESSQGPYDYLIQQGRINARELESVHQQVSLYGGSVTGILMDDYQIRGDDIGKSLALYYQVPYMQFDKRIKPAVELIPNVSFNYLRNNLWLPIVDEESRVIVLISEPSNQQKIMDIQGVLNARHYTFRISLPEHILQYLSNDSYGHNSDVIGFGDVFKSLEQEAGIEMEALAVQENKAGKTGKGGKGGKGSRRVEKSVESPVEEDETEIPAIIQLVNRIIIEANKLGASDIHIEPGRDGTPGVVRVRVDGACRDILTIPIEHIAPLITRIKVMSRLNIAERRLPQDGKCKLAVRKRRLELRVATVPTVNGESVVLRILSAGGAMPVENLMLSQRNREALLKLASQPHGLLLVVGPTGSGKTTTLHAVLGHINQRDSKIWTVEDPVEITQPGLNQVQVQTNIGFTFAHAMRTLLRADPDVILVGEMRDHETAAIGIEASLTGHLVLSTVHTNSAAETIARLLDLGLDPVNFSDALLGILAQRLMPTLCSNCKERYIPSERELKHLVTEYGEASFPELDVDLNEVTLCRPVGCADCGHSGYRGRIGVHELVVGSRELQSMIYRKASLQELREQAVKDGMRSLKQDGISKIFMGLSDYEQLLRIAGT